MNLQSNDVAVIGMSGIFPEAGNIEEYYQNLKSGKDSVRTISVNRLTDSLYDPRESYRILGFVDNIADFDFGFFGLSRSEGEAMDPVQRKLLELTYTAFESAGYGPDSFRGKKIGVFIGGDGSSYRALSGRSDAVSIIGNNTGIIAGRIAYAFDLRSSAMVIDTTCSSALTAVYEACRKIRSGEIDYAVVGSFNIALYFPEAAEVSPLSTFSKEGKCMPFDASADGIGGGEGGGVLFLKRKQSAIEEQDNIIAVIKGGAINSDGGLSNGLTAPSPDAQKQVILAAWSDAGIDPRTISYVEAHGTGTKLGDPIEFQAITEAFKVHTEAKSFCGLGSVKSNLGHLDHAAGMAGIMKVILSLKYRELFPSLHFSNPNPFIDFESSALYVNAKYQKWEAAEYPRRAGISAFGLSGTNVHLILEEPENLQEHIIDDFKDQDNNSKKYFLKLSAKTKKSLSEYANVIFRFLSDNYDANWDSLLYNLNFNRGDYKYQYTIYPSSKDELLLALCSMENSPDEKNNDAGLSVFLSNTGLDEQTIEFIVSEFPQTQLFRRRFLKSAGEYEQEFRVIADQVCWLTLLETLKIPIERIIATGLGKISQKIYNSANPDVLATDLVLQGIHLPEVDESKLKTVLNNLSPKDAVLTSIDESCVLSTISKRNSSLLTVCLDSQDTPFYNIVNYILRLMRTGVAADLRPLFQSGRQKREVPTYVFEKERCWFNTDKNYNTPIEGQPFSNALYQAKWIEDLSTSTAGAEINGKVILVFSGVSKLPNNILDELSIRNTCVLVQLSQSFELISEKHYCINSEDERDYLIVKDRVSRMFGEIGGIISCSGNSESTASAHKRGSLLDGVMHSGLYSAFFIAKTFAGEIRSNSAFIFSATIGVFDTARGINTLNGAEFGFWKGIKSDHPMSDIKYIDFAGDMNNQEVIEIICHEIQTSHDITFAHYKNGIRLVQEVSLIPEQALLLNPFLQKGVFIIPGGLGKIGRLLSAELAAQGHHLIIIGRRKLLPGSEDNEFLNRVTEKNGSYEYYQADITNEYEVEAIFRLIAGKHSSVKGILNLVGIADDWTALPNKIFRNFKSTTDSKIFGTLTLAKYGKMLNPDFFVNFSSLNSIIPKKNSFDYAAANAFQDNWSYKLPMDGDTRNISINWPGWDVFGEENGITIQTGFNLLQRVIESGRSSVIVSDKENLSRYSANPFFRLHGGKIRQDSEAFAVPASADLSDTGHIENAITRIWLEVLKADAVSIDDDFFDLGGHSLNGTQVISRINKKFDTRLDMDDLFDFATIRSLTAKVKETMPELAPVDDAIPVIPVQDFYPVSDIQKTFWINSQLQEGTRVFNMTMPFFIKGEVDITALEAALTYIINRHEALRTGFKFEDEELVQFILPQLEEPFKIRKEEAPKDTAWETYPQREHDAIFDFDDIPLVRACIVKLDYRHLFVLTVHHINVDGWSLGLIMKEFLKYYTDIVKGNTPSPVPLKIQYKDYSSWLAKELSLDTRKDSVYWSSKLHSDWPRFNKQDLAADAKRWRAGTFKISLTQEATAALKKIAVKHDCTLFMVLMTLIKVLIHRKTGWIDVVVGTVTSGRTRAELEDQVGNYLNTLAIRDELSPEMSFPELLKNVRQTTLEAYRHQLYPFPKIIEDRMKNGLQWNETLLDIQLNLHNYDQAESFFADEDSLFELPAESKDNDYDTDWNLHFNCFEDNLKVLTISMNYTRSMFEDKKMENWIAELRTIINSILENPNQRIGTLLGSQPVVGNFMETLNSEL